MQEVPVSTWFVAAAQQTTGDSPADRSPGPEEHGDGASGQHASEVLVDHDTPSSQVSHQSQQDATMAHGGKAISTSLQFDHHAHPAAHGSAEAPNAISATDLREGRTPTEQMSVQASPIGIIPAEPTLIFQRPAADASLGASGARASPSRHEQDGLPQQMPAAQDVEHGEAARAEQTEASPAAGTRRLHGHGSLQSPFKSSLSFTATSQTASRAASEAASRRPLQHEEELQTVEVNPELQQPEYDFLSGIYERKVEASYDAAHQSKMPQNLLDADSQKADHGQVDESSEDPPDLGPIDLDATVERWRRQAKPMGSDNHLTDAANQLHSQGDSYSSQPISSQAAGFAKHDHAWLRHGQPSSAERPYTHASAAAAREAAEVAGQKEDEVLSSGASIASEARAAASNSDHDKHAQQPDLHGVLPLFGPARGPRRAHSYHAPAGQQVKESAEPASLQSPHELQPELHSAGPDVANQAVDAAASALHRHDPLHAAEATAAHTSAMAMHGEQSPAEHLQLDLSLDDVDRVQIDAEPVLPLSQMTRLQRRLTTPARQVLAARHPAGRSKPHVLSHAARSSAKRHGKPSLGPATGPGHHQIKRRGHRVYEPAPSGMHQRSMMTAGNASAWEPEGLADEMQSWLDGILDDVSSGSLEQELETAPLGGVAGTVQGDDPAPSLNSVVIVSPNDCP